MGAVDYTAQEPTATERQMIDQTHAEKQFVSEKQLRRAVKAICSTIKAEETRLKEAHPWLLHQNLIGLALFAGSCAAIVATCALYLQGVLHWALAIPLVGIAGSVLHELEHDLIHNLYFKGMEWVQHVMFFVIWWAKLTIPPWYRKWLHLRHHSKSGQKEDIEERLIGTGLHMGWKRIIILLDPFQTIHLLAGVARDNKTEFSAPRVVAMSGPTMVPMCIMLHLFVHYLRAVNGWTLTQYDPALMLPMWAWPYVRDIAILMLLPNVLRQACLNIVASYCHYYGDIPEHHVFYQNQILDHPLLWPMQLFCFNFGATHIIHHFFPNQTFYVRQMLAPKVLDLMAKWGIRRNDLSIWMRANRFYSEQFDTEHNNGSRKVDELFKAPAPQKERSA